MEVNFTCLKTGKPRTGNLQVFTGVPRKSTKQLIIDRKRKGSISANGSGQFPDFKQEHEFLINLKSKTNFVYSKSFSLTEESC